MQNIQVKRYKNPVSHLCAIEPEDRSWCLFIDIEGKPTLYRRVEIKESDGQLEYLYLGPNDEGPYGLKDNPNP